jgi:hypothetical protein
MPGQQGHRDQQCEDRSDRKAEKRWKPPARGLAEQEVDARGIDSARVNPGPGVGEAEHRAGQAGSVCGRGVDRLRVDVAISYRES